LDEHPEQLEEIKAGIRAEIGLASPEEGAEDGDETEETEEAAEEV
jgi:hypothetical protein